MFKGFLSPIIIALLFLTACTTPQAPVEKDAETAALNEQVRSRQGEIDSLKTVIRQRETRPPVHLSEEAEDTLPSGPLTIRAGTHDLTLQWIGWDHPGKAKIEKADGARYRIKGEQLHGEDYLRIEGYLTPQSATLLQFDGKLIYRVADLNGGEPCDKSGQQEFLSTKGRKYWRLQNMTNCEGGLVTDYVDIYF